MQNIDDRDELARKNRRLVRILSLLLVAGFVYPMWMNARNVLIDGTLQWGSLVGALFFVLPMLLPVYAFFFTMATRERENQQRIKPQRAGKQRGLLRLFSGWYFSVLVLELCGIHSTPLQ